MKTSLSHLPEIKQAEILEILEIIKEEARPEKVILFGSHARGDWVEDEYVENGTTFSYISDYDFLVVIKRGDKKEHEIISHIENRSGHFNSMVSPIVHDFDYINQGLKFGQYFFTDIIKEGILLYDQSGLPFDEVKQLTKQEQKTKAQEYFDIWFPQATGFLSLAKYCFKEQEFRLGIFQLHQATECFYSAALLVHTGHKPKTHNLHKLRNYAKHISPELYSFFRAPTLEGHEFRLFDLLRRGYIDARYDLNYIIDEGDFEELIDKVERMKIIVRTMSEARIASLL